MRVTTTPAVAASRAVRSALCELGRAARPLEACGALLGRCEYGAWWQIASVLAVPNTAARPERNFLIPGAMVRTLERTADPAGLQVAGFFHSHPNGGTHPSATDHLCAWPGYLYAIVDALTGDVGFWVLDLERAELVEVQTADL